MLALTVWWFCSRLDNFGFVDTTIEDLDLHKRAIFYYSMAAMLLGAQFITVGFLAELMTAYHMKDASTYSIRERTDRKRTDEDRQPE